VGALEARDTDQWSGHNGLTDTIGAEAYSTARIPSLGLRGVRGFLEYIGSQTFFIDAVPRDGRVSIILVMCDGAEQAGQWPLCPASMVPEVPRRDLLRCGSEKTKVGSTFAGWGVDTQ
jgi:hypothetical protein